jgi:hypothetical protein
MKIKVILTVLIISCVFPSFSQTSQVKEVPQNQTQEAQKKPAKTIEVKGIVVDSKTDKPVQMGFIMVSGTTIGTVTDQKGKFIIYVPETAKLLAFSADGYKSQKIEYDSKNEMKIKLEPKDK